MKYFSGFCLENEAGLFESLLIQNDFSVAGFSYGAIKALEYALSCQKRIDTLQLISPAFFQDRESSFKKAQIRAFKQESVKYTQNFIQNITYNTNINLMPYLKYDTQDVLQELLYYVWEKEKLQILQKRGIQIEVYLGEKDNIINSLSVREFFGPFSTIYYFKNVGHLLK